MDIYSLSRSFWDYAFENPDRIKPNHCALYFFAVEHCNRLGWKEKFGLPTTMVMEAIGIKSYGTYIKAFNDLVDFELFTLIEKSKNQYSSNIVALSKNNKANNKALDKALLKHISKQSESTHQSIDSIDIQYTNLPINNNTGIMTEKTAFKEYVADVNSDKKQYQQYLYDLLGKKSVSRDQLFMKHKIDLEKRNEIWSDFMTTAIIEVPRFNDEDHAWNTFKKFLKENGKKYTYRASTFNGFE